MRTFRLGLSTRMVLTMLLALLLLQGLNAATFFLIPRPDGTVYSARWLILNVSDSAKAIFGAEPQQREQLARRLGHELKLDFEWRPVTPSPPPRPPASGFLARLEYSLKDALGDSAKNVSIAPRGGPGGFEENDKRQYVPPGFEKDLPKGPLTATEPDVPIFGGFGMFIEGRDGSSLRVGPPRPEFLAPFLRPPIVTAAGAILLISALSIWMAKRTLSPVDELVVAARRLGVDRQATPIDTRGLGDFAVIGEAINEMQRRIKNFVDERTEMLAAISHDLRTSLTRLRLTAEELPEGDTKATLVRDTDEMEQMVSATLAFAGDDLKREKAERLDIAALLITICDSFSDAGKEAVYSGPDHLLTTCQPVATKRAFVNIIDNAIKYGDSAQVDLTSTDRYVVVTVKDRGPGIPEELVETAFRPFSRLEQSRNRATGGVGLGLSIARDIILSQGGTINLSSPPEGGLCAVLCLPLPLQSSANSDHTL